MEGWTLNEFEREERGGRPPRRRCCVGIDAGGKEGPPLLGGVNIVGKGGGAMIQVSGMLE